MPDFSGEDVKLISAQSDCHGDCLEGQSNQEESNLKRFPLCVRIKSGVCTMFMNRCKRWIGEYMNTLRRKDFRVLWLVSFIRVVMKCITEQHCNMVGMKAKLIDKQDGLSIWSSGNSSFILTLFKYCFNQWFMLILIKATRHNMLDFIPSSIHCQSDQHCEGNKPNH